MFAWRSSPKRTSTQTNLALVEGYHPQRKHRRRVAGILGLKLWVPATTQVRAYQLSFLICHGLSLDYGQRPRSEVRSLWTHQNLTGPLSSNFGPSAYAALCRGVPASTGVESRQRKHRRRVAGMSWTPSASRPLRASLV
jgi:hypothetical protein